MPSMLHAYQAKLNLKVSKLIVFATMLIGQAIKGLHSDGLGEFFIGQIIKFVIVGRTSFSFRFERFRVESPAVPHNPLHSFPDLQALFFLSREV